MSLTRTPHEHPGGPVLLFDGECVLCHRTVAFVVKRDRRRVFRFASLGSVAGRRMTAGQGPLPDSLVLVEEGRVWVKSEAVLRVSRRLGWPWSWMWVLRVMPRGVRDWAYDAVAARRYRWFGRDRCLVPTAEVRARLLEEQES
jgi:predicted DCC family thiol-disulfide oxidoreductase YuxK